MKQLFAISVLSMLPFLASAQTAADVETVNISGDQSIHLPSQIYRMSSDEFYKFKGAYSLSNGMSLSLFERGRAMYARIDGQDQHQIIASAANSFVAKDLQLKMRIDLNDNGEASGELFYLLPSQVSADNQVVKQRWVVAVFP
ncbi:hypothetical protein [Undibacterium sp. Ren11W]|uniref:hypothetical protein n=1 Tax=Undibacterium sp. Ren11W TaxID=3413045 RepID=UPI003BF274DD